MTANCVEVESVARQEFRRRAGALGLSSVHISSPQRPGTVRAFVGGSHVRLRGDPMSGCGFGGVRGAVAGFTKASRHRMLQFLQTIDREKCGMPLFVTLTYPGEWPGDPRRWKRDLDVWLARLKRAHLAAWAVWRLEPQRRGAPHYHLLVFGLQMLAKEWLSRTWFEVVGSGDDRHLRAGTQVQRVESWRRVIGYAAKYLAKEVSELPKAWRNGVGRWWGIHRRKLAPREAMEVELQGPAYFRVRRVLRRRIGGPGVSGRRFWADGRGCGGRILRQGQRAGLSAEMLERLVRWAGAA
jgi:hypothetical protein